MTEFDHLPGLTIMIPQNAGLAPRVMNVPATTSLRLR
jgi:hypothetical protein